MKTTIKQLVEVEIKTLRVSAGVRYWEDSSFNGQEDTADGTLVPLKDGDNWEPDIDIDTGVIKDWPQGTTAQIHYKVCDAGVYWLLDAKGDTILTKDGYVPDCLATDGEGYGDYIIMEIDEDGKILYWQFTHKHLKEFEPEED